jgi:putative lipoic acid-binding regulatory protein
MSDDHAGPPIGWSLRTGVPQKRIHELVSFPCVFRFTAVATAGFVQELLSRVEKVIGRSVTSEEHSVRASAHGAYESVTLNLQVASGDEVYAIYRAMQEDARVKYLL